MSSNDRSTLYLITIYPAHGVGAVVIDMNGNIANILEGLLGMANSILPGGYVMGSTGVRNLKYGHQDAMEDENYVRCKLSCEKEGTHRR